MAQKHVLIFDDTMKKQRLKSNFVTNVLIMVLLTSISRVEQVISMAQHLMIIWKGQQMLIIIRKWI